MQDLNTPNSAEGASLSRRSFIAIAAAGTAATLPAVALVEASRQIGDLPRPLDLEDELSACVANLTRVLSDMHANAEILVERHSLVDWSGDVHMFRVPFDQKKAEVQL